MMASSSAGRLSGKVAVITGGASGIGRAIAERLVADGAQVVIGDINAEALGDVAAELGDACRTVTCDVTTEEGPATLVARAVEQFGRLDIAVANAGGSVGASIVDLSLAQWRKTIDLTLTGAFLTIQAAARAMADGGSIIAISSLSAVQPGRRVGAYSAAKAGVVALVDVAALELGSRAIRVNAVAPGMVRTPATEQMWRMPAMVEAFVENTALGRYGLPSDVSGAVAFLASDDASYITGHTLLVDGGARHLSWPNPDSVQR